MNIRDANIGDLDRIAALAEEMVQSTPFGVPKKEKIKEAILKPQIAFFVAETNNQVVGYFVGCISKHFFTEDLQAHDLALYVTESHRGSSAAVKLVKAFEAWVKNQNVKQVWFGQSVGHEIEKTQKFYERLGYKTMGVNTVKELE